MSKRRDECLFCGSRSCYCRIHTDDLSYDEVACNEHVRDLERHSDRELKSRLRTHITSTGKLARGGKV